MIIDIEIENETSVRNYQLIVISKTGQVCMTLRTKPDP